MTNRDELIHIAHAKMPFGKYKNYFLSDLPEYYIVWLCQNRLPKGTLGNQIRLIYELKLNGIESILKEIRKQNSLKK